MININREAQLAIAIHVRTAVWNWIDRFPEEFNEAIRVKPGIVKAAESGAGIPERVFDMLYNLSTYPGNERIVWPTLTMLSCMTSERISNDLQNPGYGSAKRKVSRHRLDSCQYEILTRILGNSLRARPRSPPHSRQFTTIRRRTRMLRRLLPCRSSHLGTRNARNTPPHARAGPRTRSSKHAVQHGVHKGILGYTRRH